MEGRIEELEAELRNAQAQVGHAGLCDCRCLTQGAGMQVSLA